MNKLMKFPKVILTIVMVLCVALPTLAYDFSVRGIYYNYLDKTAKTVAVTYRGSSFSYHSNEYTGSVTIPSSVTYSGTTYSVTAIGSEAFHNCTGLTSITIPNSVTSIGREAFFYCTGLTSITIPNSVTSIGNGAFDGTAWYNNKPNGILYLNNCCLGHKGRLRTGVLSIKKGTRLIGDNAFDFCKGLTSITIPNSVTSIGRQAFAHCKGLTSITIPNSVTSIGNGAFDGCDGLTELIIEDGKETLSLGYNHYYFADDIGEDLFYDCPLEKLYLGRNLNYKSGQRYGYSPFYSKTKLKEITIGNSVTSIGDEAFHYCDGLTSVTIPNSVVSIGNDAFKDCSGLTSIVVEEGNPKYDSRENCNAIVETSTNTLILGCKNSTIPNSVTSIGASAFYGCSGLTSITIPNSVTSIGNGAFDGCDGLISVTIGSGISSIPSNAFSVKPQKTIWLTNTPPSGYSNVAGTINYVANDQYSSLSNVKVYPYLSSMFEVDGVKYVPVSPSERTCDAIDCTDNPTDTIINIGNTVTFKGVAMTVKEINPYICYGNSHIKECKIDYNGNIPNYAFYDCSAIENATINANSIGNYAFNGCSAIENATINAETIGELAFKNSATINPATFSIDTKSIGNYAFNGCSAIENATINAETIGESAFENSATKTPATFSIYANSIGNYAFNDCSAIETITLGEGLGKFGNSAFSGCSKLKEVVIPNSATSLGESAFYGCSSITFATIGNAVKNINASTFYNCKSLENIIIGNGVKSIGKNSFYGCSTLPIIEIPKNITSIGDYAFDNCSNLSDVIIEDRDTVLTLGSNGSSPMFSACPLDSVYIGGDISYKTTSSYGYSPFYNNKTLRAVTITDKETEISDNEFYGCANLKSVSIGNGVETIGKYAFSGCASLESFAFGSSMKTIGEEAFSDCTALVKLRSKAMIPPICSTQALDDINKWNCELYVPGTSISAYQAADQWKEFFFISKDADVKSAKK